MDYENHNLSAAAWKIVRDYAGRRGVPDDQLDDYLAPRLEPGRLQLDYADRAVERIGRALKLGETIHVYGDYDADGITAVSILLRFFRETARVLPSWRLPNRLLGDHYGLDLDRARSMVAAGKPGLLIALDCGTNARDAVTFLKAEGVDTIEIDHHPVQADATLDAEALINPKVHQPKDREVAELCAAGLVLLVCHRLAEAWSCQLQWDHESATILACLGTLGDACTMTSTNRAIVKTGLHLINQEASISRIVGLAALLPRDPHLRVGQRRLQFEAIPKINALGRMGSADPGVELLTTLDPAAARAIAQRATEINVERQQLQQRVVESAGQQARSCLAQHPNMELLVLADPAWHHGVVGPAASRIVDMFGRSAILLGQDGPGNWRGSGRSRGRDDLGTIVNKLRTDRLIARGGGHAAAVGLGLTGLQLEHLQRILPTLAVPRRECVEPETEILGEVDELSAPDWQGALETLAPFGRGNPSPIFTARGFLITATPTFLSLSDGTVWACKVEGLTNGGQAIPLLWRDAAEAKRQWREGRRFDLRLELTCRSHRGRLFYNWMVLSCMATN
jgi:single-stranded-DNA-specific exonuclease